MTNHKLAIEAKDLKKSYKGVDVLKGLSFQIESGSVFALLGSNGAGKTTTVKILTTLIKPDCGNVNLSGYDLLRETKQIRKRIALTGQYAAIDEMLTGRENLKMIGKLLKVKNLSEQIDYLLDLFDLKEASNRRVSTYSGGMKRKVDIAMSLLGEPEILFLDEPTTGLDPQSRKSMWKTIKKLSNSGVTIF